MLALEPGALSWKGIPNLVAYINLLAAHKLWFARDIIIPRLISETEALMEDLSGAEGELPLSTLATDIQGRVLATRGCPWSMSISLTVSRY